MDPAGDRTTKWLSKIDKHYYIMVLLENYVRLE